MKKQRYFVSLKNHIPEKAMKIEQIYTNCLAQGAYYIESGGEAAIVDPLRETLPYIEKAKVGKATIKYIFETHFHADFVSGHVDLAQQTGATIVYGPGAITNFPIHVAKDGETFRLGDVIIKALHTPGHTLESVTYLLIDEKGNNHAIFTGDTLFIGDVGRPDLAVKSTLSREDLAGMLYDSLRTKIMPLQDEVIVYPAHGAGSACGKNLSKETVDTLGHQKKTNYALRADMTRGEFIHEVLEGILPPPRYFAENVALNKQGYLPLDSVLKKGDTPLSVPEFEALAKRQDTLVLDVRTQQEYVKAHIPNSIFIGLNGDFAPWVGALLPNIKQPILLVVPEGASKEAITRLARVGYDGTLGYLQGGITAWMQAGKPVETLTSIPAEEFEKRYREQPAVLDVRRQGEFMAEHLETAQHLPLEYLHEWIGNLDKNTTYYLHCAGGYRSVIAASFLQAAGFTHLVDIAGGYNALKNTHLPKRSDSVACKTTT